MYLLTIAETDFNGPSTETFPNYKEALNGAVGAYSDLIYNDLADEFSQGGELNREVKLDVITARDEEGEPTLTTFSLTYTESLETILEEQAAAAERCDPNDQAWAIKDFHFAIITRV
jgi:hypothetical protein